MGGGQGCGGRCIYRRDAAEGFLYRTGYISGLQGPFHGQCWWFHRGDLRTAHTHRRIDPDITERDKLENTPFLYRHRVRICRHLRRRSLETHPRRGPFPWSLLHGHRLRYGASHRQGKDSICHWCRDTYRMHKKICRDAGRRLFFHTSHERCHTPHRQIHPAHALRLQEAREGRGEGGRKEGSRGQEKTSRREERRGRQEKTRRKEEE